MLIQPGKLLERQILNPVKKLLNQIGYGYLSANVKYMLYPNDPSRVSDNRHYPYIRGQGWNGANVVLSAASAKQEVGFESVAAGTLGKRGRIESERTNLAFPCILPAQAAGNIVVEETGAGTANDAIAPDGTLTATKYIITLTGYTIDVFPISVTPGDMVTLSFWAKGASIDGYIRCYDITHSVLLPDEVSLDFEDQWKRYSLTLTVPSECTSLLFYPYRRASVGTNTFWMWGLNIEIGEYASTLIPSTTNALLREADAWRCTNLSGLTIEGGLVAMFRFPYPSTTLSADVYHIGLNGSDSKDDGVFIWTDASEDHLIAEVRSGGVSQGTVDLGAYIANTQYAIALDWDITGLRGCINGIEKTSSDTITVPTNIDRIEIGRGISTDVAHGGEIPLVILFTKLNLEERLNLTSAAMRTITFDGI